MTTYYRTPRGGRVPLTTRERQQLLKLYADYKVPVREIVPLFDRPDRPVTINRIYRWLPLLGVQPQA
jgi:hypothetical protein